MTTTFHPPPCTPSSDRVLAWNGIRIAYPQSWEVTGIRDRYLMLEDREGPALDLRWEVHDGAGKYGADLDQLARKLQKSGLSIRPPDHFPIKWQSPAAWHTDPDATPVPFVWSATPQGRDCIGCLLRFPLPGVTAVLRIHRDPTPANLSRAAGIISSLKIFPEQGPVPWKIYDIAYSVPPLFRLSSFSLQPGHYRFIHAGKGVQLLYDRIGPASIVLQNSSLREWTARFHGLKKSSDFDADKEQESTHSILWSTSRKRDPVPPSGLARFFRGARRWRGAVWIPPGKNMILAVTLSAASLPSDHLFHEVCSSYVLV